MSREFELIANIFLSSVQSLFLFCKSDYFIHNTLSKIIHIMNTFRLTFHRQYTKMVQGIQVDPDLFIAPNTIFLCKSYNPYLRTVLGISLFLSSGPKYWLQSSNINFVSILYLKKKIFLKSFLNSLIMEVHTKETKPDVPNNSRVSHTSDNM